MAEGRDLPVPVRRAASALVDINKRRRALQGKLLSVDMDVWDGMVYGEHPAQKMDAWELLDFAPRDGWPAALFLHGGGWQTGDKEAFSVQAPLLARRGILAISAGYRLAPEHPWPAQLQDVLAAIENLRTLQVDPTRIALWGVSVGGQLALLAAQILGPEIISAVVTVGAPADLTAWDDPALDQVFTHDQLSAASPTLRPEKLPPTLALHGALDRSVPVSQARALKAAHPEITLRVVPFADHMLRIPPGVGIRELRGARKWLTEQIATSSRRSKWKAHKKKK